MTSGGQRPAARLSVAGGLGPDDPEPMFDCVVVGSGFGASVFAARLAGALGRGRLAVLERGPEVLPGEFPERQAQVRAQVRTSTAPLGIFDLRLGRDLDAVVANVLGGGSQLYAAVTLDPLPQTFDIRRDASDPDSGRAWPGSITSDAIRPYVDRVREMLEVELWAEQGPGQAGADAQRPLLPAPPRCGVVFERAAEGLGARPQAVPLAINLTRHRQGDNRFGVPRDACTGCGNCVTGCNVGAKNALTANYLPLAAAAGAEIYTGAEVTYLRPSERPGYRYALPTTVHLPQGGTRRVTVHARMVVLGAGVFGTAGILFRSRRHGLPVSPLLGTRFSGNGDAIMLVARFAPGFTQSLPGQAPAEPGPTVTRMLDLRDQAGRRHLVQGAAVPPSLADLAAVASGGGAAADGPLVLLTMGYDLAAGRLVERAGEVEVRWPGAGRDPVQLSARATVAAMAAATGGRLRVNPRLGGANGGAPVTVHPLGGAPMGTGPDNGVVDDVGRLFHPGGGVVEGCYVADGSVIPTSVGANPSLLIAALAERAADAVLAEDLPRLLGARPAKVSAR